MTYHAKVTYHDFHTLRPSMTVYMDANYDTLITVLHCWKG